MKELKWTTVSEYVDITTGEVLTVHNARTNYQITKKLKHYEFGDDTSNPTWARVTITNECRPNDQLRLAFDTKRTI